MSECYITVGRTVIEGLVAEELARQGYSNPSQFAWRTTPETGFIAGVEVRCEGNPENEDEPCGEFWGDTDEPDCECEVCHFPKSDHR